MKNAILVLIVLVVAVSYAQEAKVISIERKDSEIAGEAWKNLQHAQKTWDHVQEVLRDKYTVVPEGDKDASNTVISSSLVGTNATIFCADQILSMSGTQLVSKEELAKCHGEQEKERKARPPSMTYRRGWENGFVFSSDFKYIVPKSPLPAPPNQWQYMSTPVSDGHCFKLEGCPQ